MYSELLRVIVTISDQEEAVNSIDLLRNSLYSKDIEMSNQLKKINAKFATPIQNLLENTADKAKILDELRLAVKSMRVLNLRLGYGYDLEFVKQMADWVKEQIGMDVIMGLEIDLTLLGGAEISFNGIYRDYSLKAALNKVWNN